MTSSKVFRAVLPGLSSELLLRCNPAMPARRMDRRVIKALSSTLIREAGLFSRCG